MINKMQGVLALERIYCGNHISIIDSISNGFDEILPSRLKKHPSSRWALLTN